MVIFSPQQYANSCGLACVSYILGVSEQDIISDNPDTLSIEKLNFVGLYCLEICDILMRYSRQYSCAQYSEQYSDRLYHIGTIVYIEQLDHYLVRLADGWGDSYRNRKGIPQFGWWNELPYEPSYIIYQELYH